MSQNELTSKVKELRELRRMSEEINAEITTIEDSLKAHMAAAGTDTLAGDDWRIAWTPITTSRFDSKALKAAMPDVYGAFLKTSEARRFTVA
jgi:predicted phage-related endonuclease